MHYTILAGSPRVAAAGTLRLKFRRQQNNNGELINRWKAWSQSDPIHPFLPILTGHLPFRFLTDFIASRTNGDFGFRLNSLVRSGWARWSGSVEPVGPVRLNPLVRSDFQNYMYHQCKLYKALCVLIVCTMCIITCIFYYRGALKIILISV